MDRDAIDNGFIFEGSVATILDGKLVPGSGNQWHSKGDVTAHGLRISCKAEQKRSWGKTRVQLKEAIDFAQGTGDIPVLAIEDVEDGEEIVIMRLSDLARAFSSGVSPIPVSYESKGLKKRAEADIPMLLREQ